MKKEFPKALPLWKLMGPSFIILALGLGSGEVILWPYLVSNFGLGIAWGALLGITFQYFINMEIERYALVKGESVFVGLGKMFNWAPYWFIVSTFVGFGIPGIIAASAKVFSHIIGITDFRWIAIPFLLLIGIILSFSKTVYTRMEKITKCVLLIGAPFILILAILLASGSDWVALGQGLVGKGDGFNFLPIGIAFATFLAAFAYSGAGGNLNLTQSIYVKEKGYGMGKYSQRISGLFRTKKNEKIKLAGHDFKLNKKNLDNFKVWWKRISIEHLIVFWFIGLVTMSLLMLLAFTTTYKHEGLEEGIDFVIGEGAVIGQTLGPIFGLLFLIAVAIMLFQTQLGVMDSTSRIMGENWAFKKINSNKEEKINLSKIYFSFLWAQIAFGIILFLFNYQPLFLIVLGAVINAFAMFVHIGLVNWMNYKVLPKQVQASIWRKIIMIGIFVFFGVFSAITLWSKIAG
ncbi:MAG: Nramp family divalent metal transporter [Nanoarchaeota archaeon]